MLSQITGMPAKATQAFQASQVSNSLSTSARVVLSNLLAPNSHSIIQSHYRQMFPNQYGPDAKFGFTVQAVPSAAAGGGAALPRPQSLNAPYSAAHSNTLKALQQFDPANPSHSKFLATTILKDVSSLSDAIQAAANKFNSLNYSYPDSQHSKEGQEAYGRALESIDPTANILRRGLTLNQNKEQIVAFIKEYYKSLHEQNPKLITMAHVNKKIVELQDLITKMEKHIQFIGKVGDKFIEGPKTKYLDLILENRKFASTEKGELEAIYKHEDYNMIRMQIQEMLHYLLARENARLKEAVSSIQRIYPQDTIPLRALLQKVESLKPYFSVIGKSLMDDSHIAPLETKMEEKINELKSIILDIRPNIREAALQRIINNLIMKEVENLRIRSLARADGANSNSYSVEQTYINRSPDFQNLLQDDESLIFASTVREALLRYLHDNKILRPNEYILLTYKKASESPTAHDVNIAVYNYETKFPSAKTTTIQLDTKNMKMVNDRLHISNLERLLTPLKKLTTPEQRANFYSQRPTSPITPTPPSPEDAVSYTMVLLGKNEKLMHLYLSNLEHLLDTQGVGKYIIIDDDALKWIQGNVRFKYLLNRDNVKFITIEAFHKMVLKTTVENQTYRNGNPFADPALQGGTLSQKQAKIDAFFNFISELIEKRGYAGAKDLLVSMVRFYNKQISSASLKIEMDGDVRLQRLPHSNLAKTLAKTASESSYVTTMEVTNAKSAPYERRAILATTYSDSKTHERISKIFSDAFKKGSPSAMDGSELSSDVFVRGYHEDSLGNMETFLNFLHELETQGFLKAFLHNPQSLSIQGGKVHVNGKELVLSKHKFTPETDLMECLASAVKKRHAQPERIVSSLIKFVSPILSTRTDKTHVFPAEHYGVEGSVIDSGWSGKGPWTPYESLSLRLDKSHDEYNRGIIRAALSSLNVTPEYIATLTDPAEIQAAKNHMINGNLSSAQIEERIDYYMEKINGIHKSGQESPLSIASISSSSSASTGTTVISVNSLSSSSGKTTVISPNSSGKTTLTASKSFSSREGSSASSSGASFGLNRQTSSINGSGTPSSANQVTRF